MKTIQQQIKLNFAKKYFAKSDNPKKDIDRKTDYETGFYDGVAFAQRWIGVNEELPKPDTDVIVRFTIVQGCYEYALAEYSDDCIWHWRGNDFKQPQNITDWRPIELE